MATDTSSSSASAPRGHAAPGLQQEEGGDEAVRDDVSAARDWYRELLGIDAYFQRPDAEHPAYVEFRVGDHEHELGIVARSWAPDGWEIGSGGVILYWHVDDLEAAVERLLAMGAMMYEPVTERGPGFVTAA